MQEYDPYQIKKNFQAMLVNFHQCSDIVCYSKLLFIFTESTDKEKLKAYESLESYNQFTPGGVKEVKIKLFLNYLGYWTGQ